MSSGRTVSLWSHRLLDPSSGTGLGRYVEQMVLGLGAIGAESGLEYDIRSVADDTPTWSGSGIPVVPIDRRRRPLHLGWMLGLGPALEDLTGPTSLVHSLYPSHRCKTSRPLIVTIHDLYPLENPEWYSTREATAARSALRQAADQAAAIITDSAWTAERVRSTLGIERDRLHVVHLGVSHSFDTGRRGGLHHDPPPYVLAIGHVGPRKNLGLAVRACSHLPDVRLVCAGPVDPAEGARLSSLATQMGMEQRLDLRGAVSDAELADLLSGAIALVHPSLSEGFGFTPLEAMAAGVPAVVADSGSLPEVCRDGAQILDPSDPTAWADAIDGLRRDDDVRDGWSRAGRRVAADYTWDRTLRATNDVHLRTLDPAGFR